MTFLLFVCFGRQDVTHSIGSTNIAAVTLDAVQKGSGDFAASHLTQSPSHWWFGLQDAQSETSEENKNSTYSSPMCMVEVFSAWKPGNLSCEEFIL